MDNSLLSLKICLAVLLVLVLVQHFPAVQSHGTGRHGRPSQRPPRRHRPHGATPPRHHSWSGSGAPPTGRHHSLPTGKHPKPKAVWVLVQFGIYTDKKLEKDLENKNSESYRKLAKHIVEKLKVSRSPYARRVKEVHFKYFKKGKKGVVAVLALSVLTPPPPKHGKKKGLAETVERTLMKILYGSGLKITPKSVLVKPMDPKGIKHGMKQGKKHRRFRGVIRLLESWKESLKDNTSTEYQKLAKRFHKVMVKVFGKELVALRMDRFRKGSIIVDFHLELNSSMSGSAADVRTKLEKQMGHGQLGDMKVDKTSLKIDDDAEEPADHDKLTEERHHRRHLSHETKAAIVVVALVLVCLCIFVGIWYFVKRNKARKLDSTVQEFDNPVKFGAPTNEA